MKIQFTAKQLIVGCIVFALGLMTLLTLCIPLLKVDDTTLEQLLSRYLMDIKTYESGFTLLDFESSAGMDTAVAIICGIFSMFQLLLSIATMIFAPLSIFVFDKAKAKKILRALAISCMVFIGAYMIWGIVFGGTYGYLSVYKDGSWGLSSSSSRGWSELYYETTTYTQAYIGFIFGTLLFVGYIVCTLKLKDDFVQKQVSHECTDGATKTNNTQNEERHSNNLTQASEIAEVLKQYKDLLDNGIITQEEFDEKKKSILN